MEKHLKNVFRSWFSKSAPPLTGAPPTRRLKTYSSQTGYVYQYYYEGHRAAGSGEDCGTEFVFSVSSDRKRWHAASVLVSDGAVHDWESSHQRVLSSTERYAVAKMALFQAFDERAAPEQMSEQVRVRPADVEGIIEMLGL